MFYLPDVSRQTTPETFLIESSSNVLRAGQPTNRNPAIANPIVTDARTRIFSRISACESAILFAREQPMQIHHAMFDSQNFERVGAPAIKQQIPWIAPDVQAANAGWIKFVARSS